MTEWVDLSNELDAWAAAGRVATLWWRDDDARRPGPALDRLVELAAVRCTPVALAVVPGETGVALADWLATAPCRVDVLPHGLDHRNRAPADEKKAEFGPHRPLHEMLADVAIGWERMRALFASTPPCPVFVPPWNRIDPALVRRLADAGLRGLSAFGARAGRWAAPDVVQANAHADIIDWRGTRGFVGEAAALGAIVDHLAARRRGAVDPAEPSGLLTHHLEHDEDCWRFIGRLLAETGDSRARWLSAAEIFTFQT